MGLGFFIAKTLIERSSGSLTLQNQEPPGTGAAVKVILRRDSLTWV
jgi:two-component system sensor histidine kinase RegB